MNENMKRKILYLYYCLLRSAEKRDLKMKIDLFDPKYKYKDSYTQEIQYMKDRDIITMFPYSFREKYNDLPIDVFWDNKKKLHYVIHLGKKLYYPADMTEEGIRNTYRAILLEQDEESPHRYFSRDFNFEEGDIFCDIGCAEGNMALEVVDRATALLLFEAEEKWIPALQATFEPWQDKVYIINKFAGDYMDDKTTTIAYELKCADVEGRIYFKIDAEGSEKSILKGMEEIIAAGRVSGGAVCTYHRQEDGDAFKELFEDMGFLTQFSDGYVIYRHSEELKPPYFRRGLIRVKKD